MQARLESSNRLFLPAHQSGFAAQPARARRLFRSCSAQENPDPRAAQWKFACAANSCPPRRAMRKANMKPKTLITAVCVLALLTLGPTPTFASSDWDRDAIAVTVDITVARPITFALTLLGSAVFVVSLPVAIPAGGVHKTAHTLVAKPARNTFSRPIGDLENLWD